MVQQVHIVKFLLCQKNLLFTFYNNIARKEFRCLEQVYFAR